jgi:hypothetical protein
VLDAPRREDRRQRWARDVTLPPEADDVFLDPDRIDHFKAGARVGRYRCPVPGCPQPLFWVRRNRHVPSFVHRAPFVPDASHSESMIHHEAKNVLGQWLRERYPEPVARVVIDREAVDSGQRPHVLVMFADGRVFAFEVQYAGISSEQWRQRHCRYVAQGITDVWLFGLLRAHWQPVKDAAPPRVREVPVFETLREQAVVVRWIDRDQHAILTCRRETATGCYETSGGIRLLEYGIDPLNACRIEGSGFLTPTDDQEVAMRLAREQKAAQQREQERLAQERAREAAAREAEQQRVASERAAQEAKARNRLTREQAQVKVALDARRWAVFGPAWENYQRDHFPKPDSVPDVILHTQDSDWSVGEYTPPHWHALLFKRHIDGKVGHTFLLRQAAEGFRPATAEGEEQVVVSVRRYVEYLRDQGYVRFGTTSFWSEDRAEVLVEVLADTINPPLS